MSFYGHSVVPGAFCSEQRLSATKMVKHILQTNGGQAYPYAEESLSTGVDMKVFGIH